MIFAPFLQFESLALFSKMKCQHVKPNLSRKLQFWQIKIWTFHFITIRITNIFRKDWFHFKYHFIPLYFLLDHFTFVLLFCIILVLYTLIVSLYPLALFKNWSSCPYLSFVWTHFQNIIGVIDLILYFNIFLNELINT